MTSQPIIDAHHHLWDLNLRKHPWLDGRREISTFRYGNYSKIMKNYLLSDYQKDWANHTIVKSIYVEAEWDPNDPIGETEWVQRYHDETGFPNAMVAQIWFEQENANDILQGHSAFPIVRSVRQKPKTNATQKPFDFGEPGSMSDPKFRKGYRKLSKYGLHYDLQTPWWHLREAADLAQTFPETLIILNHTGLPADRSPEGLKNWLAAIQEFAFEPNTAVKISGIGVQDALWVDNENSWIILKTIETFGVNRCMFASNFPVDSLCTPMEIIYNKFKTIVKNYPLESQAALFHDNAVNFYKPL